MSEVAQAVSALDALTNLRVFENDHGYSILGERQAEVVLSAIAAGKIPGVEAVTARAPSPAVGGEVTWEEAEQVAQQFCNTAIGVRSWSKFCHVEQLDIIVEMRAALEAFVRGRGKP